MAGVHGLYVVIRFTMSIFITNLAFSGQSEVINASKAAIPLAFLTTGIIGFVWLKIFGKPLDSDFDINIMDFEAGAALPPSNFPQQGQS